MMRQFAADALSAIFAAFVGWVAQQTATVLDPSVGPIDRNLIGAGIFAVVLTVCLVAVRLPARRWQ